MIELLAILFLASLLFHVFNPPKERPRGRDGPNWDAEE